MDMIRLDMRGKQCPIPVIETKKAFARIVGEGCVETRVDNQTAVENLKRLASSLGGSAEVTMSGDCDYLVRITASGQAEAASAPVDCVCAEPAVQAASGPMIAVFSSDRMGTGDEKLGAILMKGFIYALSQLEELPEKCVFYNSGARLTTADSVSLADLKSMEEAGTELITCGTCADFYGIKEQIAVGRIGNMYDIVSTMAQAGKILRP